MTSKNSDDTAESLIAVAADAERRFAELKELFTSFLGNMPALSFIKDDQGRYLYASKSFAEFFEVEPEKFLMKTDFEWLPTDIARQFTENDEQVRRTGAPIQVIEKVPKNGKVIESLVQKFPVPVSDPASPGQMRTFVGGIALDITERQNATERIRKLADDLEALSYSVSHELQEPVRTIKSYHNLLAVRYKGRLGEDADSFIQKCTDAALTIEKMIAALWTYARIDKDNSFKNIDPHKALGTALSNISELIAQTDAQITYDQLPMVRASEEQLTILFAELLRNALQNCDQRPEVHIGATRLPDAHVSFFVRDNGRGIDPMVAKDAFRLFRRTAMRRPDATGAGMGLSIAQRIVEHHGGKLSIKANEGNGSTFLFTIAASTK